MNVVGRSDLLVCDHCNGQAERETAMGWFRLSRPDGITVMEDWFGWEDRDACSIPCATALITMHTAGSRQQPLNPEVPA